MELIKTLMKCKKHEIITILTKNINSLLNDNKTQGKISVEFKRLTFNITKIAIILQR